MSSDGRYLYHSPQEVAPQYAYPPYASYDAAQYPPSSSRPARNGAPPPHPSPPQQPQPAPYSAPPQGYPQPGYPPPSYGVPPQPNAAPWTAPEGPWPPYTAPAFVPPASAVPQGTPQGFGRPDAQPQQPASETSSASPGGPAHPDNRRVEERAERAGGDSAPPTKGRKNNRTDSENPGPTPLSPASAALDYNKLIESYRVILDTANTIAVNTSAGAVENLEQMIHAAMYGQTVLDAAAQRTAADMVRSAASAGHAAEEAEGPARTRQVSISRGEQVVEGGQTCLGCNATSTPEWRRGPMGPRTLCNACGLVYAKLLKKRTREPGRSRGSGQARQSNPDALSSGEDISDNESSGSQERRSDSGDAARR